MIALTACYSKLKDNNAFSSLTLMSFASPFNMLIVASISIFPLVISPPVLSYLFLTLICFAPLLLFLFSSVSFSFSFSLQRFDSV